MSKGNGHGGARKGAGRKPKYDQTAVKALLDARMDLKAEAEKHAPAALARIVELVGSSDERVALSAAETILDRAYGKAAQTVDSKSEVSVTVHDGARDKLAALLAVGAARSGTHEGNSATH